MRCNSSKFLLISILTFVVGFGIVQVWQDFKYSTDSDIIKQDLVKNFLASSNPNHPQKISCEEIRNYSSKKARDKRYVNRGVLNFEACLVEPIYPKEAITNSIEGQVNVEVLVDGLGVVKFAKAISGNPILWNSAVEAAYKTKIKPSWLRGEPVNVKGILVFKFVLPN